MSDRMRKKVAVAILKGGSFNPDKDEMRWARLSARAALDACHFDELVTALKTLSNELAPWLTTADAGLPAVVKTLGDSATLHTAQRTATALLAKVEAGDA